MQNVLKRNGWKVCVMWKRATSSKTMISCREKSEQQMSLSRLFTQKDETTRHARCTHIMRGARSRKRGKRNHLQRSKHWIFPRNLTLNSVANCGNWQNIISATSGWNAALSTPISGGKYRPYGTTWQQKYHPSANLEAAVRGARNRDIALLLGELFS
jgi:hypothetical protein